MESGESDIEGELADILREEPELNPDELEEELRDILESLSSESREPEGEEPSIEEILGEEEEEPSIEEILGEEEEEPSIEEILGEEEEEEGEGPSLEEILGEEPAAEEEEVSEESKRIKQVAAKVEIPRVKFIPSAEEEPKPTKQQKKAQRRKRKELSEEQRKAETVAKKKAASERRKEQLRKATSEVREEKFTLFENLNQFLKERGVGEQFETWMTTLITPQESHCMIAQTSECTDVNRLSLLMDIILENKSPREDQVKLHEVLELIHDKTAKYHSEVGMRYGYIAYASRPGRASSKQRLDEIRLASDVYIENISKIVEWLLDDENLDYLFPYESIPKDIRDAIAVEVPEEQLPQFGMMVRRRALKDRLFRLISIDADDILRGASNLSSSVQAQYLQKRAVKSTKTWEKNRYSTEVQQLYRLMYKTVRIRDDLIALRGLDSKCDLNHRSRELYLQRQRQITDMFADYFTRYSNILGVLMTSKMIPSPFAQSTYLVQHSTLEQFDLCNMLMWPDGFARTLNPNLRNLIEFTDKSKKTVKALRSQIICDYLDPWYYYYYRRNGFPLVIATLDGQSLKRVLLSRIAIYFSRGQQGSLENYDPGPNEYKDMKLFNGSTRILNNENEYYEDRVERSPERIYLVQYLNRLARGLGRKGYWDDEKQEWYTEGDYVWYGQTEKQLVDILHTGPDTVIRKTTGVRIAPSEFTNYMEPLEVVETNGSYLTYRIDIHPGVFQSGGQDLPVGFERYAGHAYRIRMQFSPYKKTPPVWFKTTLKLDKPEGSSKSAKVLEELDSTWVANTIQVDAVCDNSKSYPWKTFPEWMLLMFKMIASFIYANQDSYQKFLIMIPLDKLKRSGNIPENVLTYLLRRYLNFGLCVNESVAADPEEGRSGLYIGRDEEEYDYDFILSDFVKIYSRGVTDEGQVSRADQLEIVDETEPILIRPLPTLTELWGMWRFYTQEIVTRVFGIDQIGTDDLNTFLRRDQQLKSGHLRLIKQPGYADMFTSDVLADLTENNSFDPLGFDDKELDWAQVLKEAREE